MTFAVAANEKGEKVLTMAKEYIEREALLHKIRWASSAEEAVMSVRSIPAADVVEVVRCCNCEFHDHDGTSGYCNHWRRWSNMSDFCSRGK